MTVTTLLGQMLSLPRPLMMGVVNVTPDSFSDGGNFLNINNAIDHSFKLLDEGADILDIGGESTRPNAVPVSPDVEMSRVLPVIEVVASEVARRGKVISVDTRHAVTMAAAVRAGALMVNDVTALTGDADSVSVVRDSGVHVCLMHMQGAPDSMQKNPFYNNVLQDIVKFLDEQCVRALAAGISADRLMIDPGIGFGKTLDHNLAILRGLDVFTALPYPVLLGASRKRFIEGVIGGTVPVDQRLGGSLAAVIRGVKAGVKIFRVHDVLATKQAVDVYNAVTRPEQEF